MENARIAVFEDSHHIRGFLKLAAEMSSHSIVAEAAELQTAVEVIDQNEFDVAIVDGNLNPDKIDCTDGKTIITALKSKRPEAAIIWFSSIPAQAVNAECDADVGKDVFHALEAVDRL